MNIKRTNKIRKAARILESVLGFISVIALILFMISLISAVEAWSIAGTSGTILIISSAWLALTGLYIRFIKM